MFRLSLVLACWAVTAEAFAPLPLAATRIGRSPISLVSMQENSKENSPKSAKGEIGPQTFSQLDVNQNGLLESRELWPVLGDRTDDLMSKADVDNNQVVDYPEFERLLNMIKNGEEQGGNMWVRSATNAGLLKKESPLVDSMLAGNKGFDPLNLASSPEKLRKYRDAELKHGRLAMLAALGWPVSELLHPLLSFVTGMPNQLALNGKAPSVLNGGLEKFPSFFLGLILVTGTIESLTLTNFVPSFSPAFQFKEGKKLVPGNFGWDPLQISKGTPEDFKRELEFKEINNGRLAMIGITAMALKEFLSGVPIV